MAPSLEVSYAPELNGSSQSYEKIPTVVDVISKGAIEDAQPLVKTVVYPKLQPDFEIEDHPIDIIRKLRVCSPYPFSLYVYV
jgi:hypothetical protein